VSENPPDLIAKGGGAGGGFNLEVREAITWGKNRCENQGRVVVRSSESPFKGGGCEGESNSRRCRREDKKLQKGGERRTANEKSDQRKLRKNP